MCDRVSFCIIRDESLGSALRSERCNHQPQDDAAWRTGRTIETACAGRGYGYGAASEKQRDGGHAVKVDVAVVNTGGWELEGPQGKRADMKIHLPEGVVGRHAADVAVKHALAVRGGKGPVLPVHLGHH